MTTDGERRFLRRFQYLYHVADRAAVPHIRAHGLLPAEALCALFKVPAERREALLSQNRDRYEPLLDDGTVTLRRQYLRDGALRQKLDPAITPAEWRRMVNRQVHLWPGERKAARLDAYEGARDQVVLRWEAETLVRATIPLLTCQWNNGTTANRQRPGRRLRTWSDYKPLAAFAGGPVTEIVVRSAIPASIPFELLRCPTFEEDAAGWKLTRPPSPARPA